MLSFNNSGTSGMRGGGEEAQRRRTVQFESHTGTLLSGLNALRSQGLLLDVTLEAGCGRAFGAHRVVLASCSDYFRAMFTDAMRERSLARVRLEGVTGRGLAYLLEYAYTSRLALSPASVQDVLAAAAHVQLQAVVEACAAYLREQLDLDNCADVATIAEMYSLQQLLKEVYLFMCGNLLRFSERPEFLRLSAAQLEAVLRSDFPVDCPEAQVLAVVLRWLEARPPRDRLPHARALLRYVHFGEISAADIAALPESPLLKCLRLWGCRAPAPRPLVNSRGMELAVLKVGGFGSGGLSNDIAYLLPGGRWRYLTSIPHVEQACFGTAVLGNELFVVGGCFNQSLQENVHPFGFRYSPLTNAWATMAPMARERCRFALGAVGEEAASALLAVGGAGEADVADDRCERYDPAADAWAPAPPLPAPPRTQHAGASWRDRLYVCGGLDPDSAVLDSLWRLDAGADGWRPCAPMLAPRADHAMVCRGDDLLVCGGWREEEEGGGRALADTVDRYSVARDAWSVLTRVPTPRYHAGVAVVGARLFVVGGFHSATTFDRASGAVEVFDLETGAWSAGERYPQDIWEHACCTLYVPRCRDDLEVIPDRDGSA